MSYLRYFGIVVSNTYCVVSLFCFFYVVSFSGLSMFDCPSVFSNVYFIYKHTPTAYYKKNFTVLVMFMLINLKVRCSVLSTIDLGFCLYLFWPLYFLYQITLVSSNLTLKDTVKHEILTRGNSRTNHDIRQNNTSASLK